jgi:transcriptional regulator with XRE-family HTH domain
MAMAPDEALRLRLLLEIHDLDQTEVARAAGVSRSLVSHWLAGTRRPTTTHEAAIRGLIATRPLLRSER